MASVEENLDKWNIQYDWKNRGDEWSRGWGGVDMHWFGSILPRIQLFLPNKGNILEIAPGFGRWTSFLEQYAKIFYGVDISEKCIFHCSERFKNKEHANFYVNDGKSLNMIPDGSIDFVFSYDSLVHAESEVLFNYLKQLTNKLSINGVGFIHHSNMNEYTNYFKLIRRIPIGGGILSRLGLIETKEHLRAHSMSANIFKKYCDDVGLKCIGQELINWDSKRTIDCYSFFCKKGSRWDRTSVVVSNANFMKEVKSWRRIADISGKASYQKK